jgi:hypothetical protein
MYPLRWRYTGSAAGIIFAACLFLSLAVVDPFRGLDDRELTAWWSESANIWASVQSMYARLAAIPFLLVFVAHLRSRLHTVEGEAWEHVMSAAASVCAAMLAVSALARGVTALAVLDVEIDTRDSSIAVPMPGVDVLRFETELAYQAFGVAAIGAFALIVAVASLLILATDAFPLRFIWLGKLGLLIAMLGFATIPLRMGPFVSPLLLIWVVLASYALARAPTANTA